MVKMVNFMYIFPLLKIKNSVHDRYLWLTSILTSIFIIISITSKTALMEREVIGFGLEVIFQFVFLHADSFQFH